MASFLFGPGYKPDSLISIMGLQSQFEDMGIKENKCKKLARFLIEPESSTNYMYNALLQAKGSLILENLKKLVG